MTNFHYGILIVLGILVFAVLKADYNARVWVTLALVGGLGWYYVNRKKR